MKQELEICKKKLLLYKYKVMCKNLHCRKKIRYHGNLLMQSNKVKLLRYLITLLSQKPGLLMIMWDDAAAQ